MRRQPYRDQRHLWVANLPTSVELFDDCHAICTCILGIAFKWHDCFNRVGCWWPYTYVVPKDLQTSGVLIYSLWSPYSSLPHPFVLQCLCSSSIYSHNYLSFFGMSFCFPLLLFPVLIRKLSMFSGLPSYHLTINSICYWCSHPKNWESSWCKLCGNRCCSCHHWR